MRKRCYLSIMYLYLLNSFFMRKICLGKIVESDEEEGVEEKEKKPKEKVKFLILEFIT